MSNTTNTNLFNSTIYSVYVRSHTESGDFKGLISDLDRIANLGVDTIWLMPIHPIGIKERKGTLGCPYSIKDYRSINPEYGTLEDFKTLLDEIHNHSLKCIIDIVFNHTSKDSTLAQSNPEYFLKDSNGNFISKIEEWSDIADFDYSNTDFWDELIDTLIFWRSLGVDGFRCDAASLVPIDFWIKARREVHSKYPDTIFLAESCGFDFVELVRSQNYKIYTDSELFQAFDIVYDYDMKDSYYHLLNTNDYSPNEFVYRLFIQNNMYPENAVKLRFMENHDTKRTAEVIKNYYELVNYTAMMFFQKGAVLLYAGQETLEKKTPSLFEKELIDFNIKNQEFYDLLKNLICLKKDVFFMDGFFRSVQNEDKNTVHLSYTHQGKTINGVFNLNDKVNEVTVNLPDGEYDNIINNQKIFVENHMIDKKYLPAFFQC